MEANVRKCKTCGELKHRILVGKYDTYNKKYVDEFGKAWSGNYCPDCNKLRVRNLMTRKRTSVPTNG